MVSLRSNGCSSMGCNMKGRATDEERPDDAVSHFEPQSFAVWIKRSPQNVRDFLRETAIELELKGLDAEHVLDLGAVVARARADLTRGNFGESGGATEPSPPS
jgi:hypothetical protein